MNNFNCTARLGKDCEVRALASGASVCSFNGAVDAGYGDNKKTLWVRFIIWGKRAEGRLPEFLVKGCQVAVVGELSQNEWEDKDGNTRSTLECNVRDLDLIGGQQKQESNEIPAQQNNYAGTGGMSDDVPF